LQRNTRAQRQQSDTCGAVSPKKSAILRRKYSRALGDLLWEIGAGKMNRTPDLRITNALLYQLSYTGFLIDYFFTLG
jgi:hypothetical protein